MLSREADDRAPGEPGDAEPRDRIREAAARGDRQYPGSAARAGVAVGGVGARLLVAHVNHLHAVLPQAGEDGPGVAAVQREEMTDPLLAQHLADDGAPVDSRRARVRGLLDERFAHGARPVHGVGL